MPADNPGQTIGTFNLRNMARISEQMNTKIPSSASDCRIGRTWSCLPQMMAVGMSSRASAGRRSKACTAVGEQLVQHVGWQSRICGSVRPFIARTRIVVGNAVGRRRQATQPRRKTLGPGRLTMPVRASPSISGRAPQEQSGQGSNFLGTDVGNRDRDRATQRMGNDMDRCVADCIIEGLATILASSAKLEMRRLGDLPWPGRSMRISGLRKASAFSSGAQLWLSAVKP